MAAHISPFMKCNFSLHFSSQNIEIDLRRVKAKVVTRSVSSLEFIWRKTMSRRIYYISCATQKVLLTQDFESLHTRIFFATDQTVSRLSSFYVYVFVWDKLPALRFIFLFQKFDINLKRVKTKVVARSKSRVKFIWRETMREDQKKNSLKATLVQGYDSPDRPT